MWGLTLVLWVEAFGTRKTAWWEQAWYSRWQRQEARR